MSDHMDRSTAANLSLLRGRIENMAKDAEGAKRLLPRHYTLSDDTRATLLDIENTVAMILEKDGR